MKIKPLHDRVLVQRDQAETETHGGLILAGAAQETPETGTVLAVGPEVTELQAGDRVVFSKFSGQSVPVKLAGPGALVLKVGDILGIAEK